MKPRSRTFKVTDAVLVGRAADFRDPREPELRIGDRVRLNSGGPTGLVVDIESDAVTVGWGQGRETTLDNPCWHRVRYP